jgi:hypothetical protein
MQNKPTLKSTMVILTVCSGLISSLALAAASKSESSSASNATTVKLAQVKGRVLVNNGAIYTQANSGTLVQTGSKIIAGRGASVTVLYKDGCTKKVAENSMLTVGNSNECTSNNFKERTNVAAAPGDTVTDTPAPLLTAATNTGPAILTWATGLLGVTGFSSNSNSNSNSSNPAVSLE